MNYELQTIIIGSGPAGLTAAIYTSRAHMKTLVISGAVPGGQLMITSDVENFPGFPTGITGPELMSNMRQQAIRFGTEFIDKNVTGVDFSKEIKKVTVDNVDYYAPTVIIATGASAMWLGIPGEQEFMGKGVSGCATCDGAFFKNKIVAVVGGGDTAMEEATFLTHFATKVYLIHRRDSFRASKIMQEKAKQNPKIEIMYNTVVEKINGSSKVNSITTKNIVDNSTINIDVDGVFVAIGHKPNTDFLNNSLTLNDTGYIVNKPDTEVLTDLNGIFIAGDVYDYRYRQAITAAGSGCKAALEAEKYLALNNIKVL